MQRVVLLIVGILSVVGATSLGMGKVDRLNFFLNTWVEKDEFGRDAYSENSEYKVVTLKDNSNIIDKSDTGKSLQGLRDLFGNLEYCGDYEKGNYAIGEKGCVTYAYGDVYFMRVLSSVDIKDVHKAFKYDGIGECKEAADHTFILPKGGCYHIDTSAENINLYGAYNDDEVHKIEEISRPFGSDVNICLNVVDLLFDQGCFMHGTDGFHLLNVLNKVNIADVKRLLSNLNIKECKIDGDGLITNVEACYTIDTKYDSVHLFKVFTGNGKFSPHVPPSVKTTKGMDLQTPEIEGLLNRPSPVIKISKEFLQKNVQLLLEAQKERRFLQHGRLNNNGESYSQS